MRPPRSNWTEVNWEQAKPIREASTIPRFGKRLDYSGRFITPLAPVLELRGMKSLSKHGASSSIRSLARALPQSGFRARYRSFSTTWYRAILRTSLIGQSNLQSFWPNIPIYDRYVDVKNLLSSIAIFDHVL